MDDAVNLIFRFGTVLAMIDLKTAFRMVPIHQNDWDLLGMQCQGSFYLDSFYLRHVPTVWAEILSLSI